MKKTLLLLFLGMAGLCQQVGATGPLRRTFSVQQSDGTYLEIQKHGNGKYVFYTTTDGIALMRAANGDYQYAEKVENGLKPMGICAHESSARSQEDMKQLSFKGLTMTKAYQWMNSVFKESPKSTRGMGNRGTDGLGIYGQTGAGIVKSIGSPVIPVVMVEFPDRKFMDITTADKVERMLNEKGYSDEEYCVGSVKDYFESQSNGLFKPSFKVVAKVQVSKPYAVYGKNSSNGAIDVNVSALIREALDSAHVAAGVDFKEFAKDAGRVPLVSVYYAGPGEHSAFEEGCENYIWAHFSQTSNTIGGVTINSYFVGNETMQEYKKGEDGLPHVVDQFTDGIGIFCHEFGHALGLPDFYVTRGQEPIDTPDFWSIMDYGQYFYEGYAPIGYSAFERSSLGWLDIKELKTPQEVTLYPFGQEEKGATAYCIKNDKNPKEYFILENRQPGTWYSDLMGHGMLITHVDYNESAWMFNSVNNDKNHQRYEVIPADNVKNGHLDNGRPKWDWFKADLFPGLNGVTAFTDDTTPASKVFTGEKLGKPVTDIQEKDGVISFKFMNPEETGIEDVIDNSAACEVYSLSGHKMVNTSNLHPGVYIVKQGDVVKKVLVK